ncbi:thioredoxin-dependent thiol peroxidase [Temperatibacter marinus]|uniref:thioredoxin-dependent peroxiredoxin n=1 Tax=Temperatibacter marinus TaxID=1456591 RepID=A0AA52EGC0_9PROT|nr:thioredoxin-dependent thiol peroxidase [Temperatibacter marinus]WND02275.1 thioredoxin-dependent thiol peroxidase [Temperatibacter marinus]
MTLSIGDKAPDFSLPGNGGKPINLSDYAGKKLVIFFYPKASTPGCTTEAIDFTANLATFEATGCSVIGASKDSVKRQDNFITKNDLGVRLVSDEDGAMLEAYGVWQEKKNYGKTYMGIVRSTFLIDEKGCISQIWDKVRVKGHVDAVLAAAQGI